MTEFRKEKIRIDLVLELSDCRDCPMVLKKTTPSSLYAKDYFCKATKDLKKIMGYVEFKSDLQPIPFWCPYKLKDKK